MPFHWALPLFRICLPQSLLEGMAMKRFLTSTFLLALPFTASAQTAISQLPAASTPLTGTELLPLVQSGVTKSVTATNLRGAFYPGLVCDGATNITSPVQSAVTAAQSAGGGTIWLPAYAKGSMTC